MILNLSNDGYELIKKNDGTGTLYPDHIFSEDYFSYLLKNSFTKEQKSKILFDHGENEEYYYKYYNPNNVISNLINKIKNYKPIKISKKNLYDYDSLCCLHH